jgi:hypothetical protein
MEHDLPGNIESKFLFLIYFLHYHCWIGMIYTVDLPVP